MVVADCIVTHESQYQTDEGQGDKHPFVVRYINSP